MNHNQLRSHFSIVKTEVDNSLTSVIDTFEEMRHYLNIVERSLGIASIEREISPENVSILQTLVDESTTELQGVLKRLQGLSERLKSCNSTQ